MKMLGIVDNINTCDCCGKTGLVKTVALDNGGEVVYYGVTCASVALGFGREYTSRNAHKLVTRVQDREHYAKLKAAAVERAQAAANAEKQTYLVLFQTSKYQKRGWYSVMDEARYIHLNSWDYGRISAEVHPQ